MLSVENLRKVYPSRAGVKVALNDVSFTLHKGQKIGIIGNNGAGKSTLIRLLAGTEKPSSGRIDRRMSISWPIAFGGGFQGSLTGIDNIKFVCRIYGADYVRALCFVEDFSELGKDLREPVRTYSSGMLARLAFALSLAVDFDCLLVDEVIAVGDERFRQKCFDEIFIKRAANSLILVSHDRSVVKQYCETAGILVEGKLHVVEDIDHAYDQWHEIEQRKTADRLSIS